MKLIKKSNTETEIEVGDIVNYIETDEIGILSYNPARKNFPYQIIGLQTGEVIDCITSINKVGRFCELVAKNRDATLSY